MYNSQAWPGWKRIAHSAARTSSVQPDTNVAYSRAGDASPVFITISGCRLGGTYRLLSGGKANIKYLVDSYLMDRLHK